MRCNLNEQCGNLCGNYGALERFAAQISLEEQRARDIGQSVVPGEVTCISDGPAATDNGWAGSEHTQGCGAIITPSVTEIPGQWVTDLPDGQTTARRDKRSPLGVVDGFITSGEKSKKPIQQT